MSFNDFFVNCTGRSHRRGRKKQLGPFKKEEEKITGNAGIIYEEKMYVKDRKWRTRICGWWRSQKDRLDESSSSSSSECCYNTKKKKKRGEQVFDDSRRYKSGSFLSARASSRAAAGLRLG